MRLRFAAICAVLASASGAHAAARAPPLERIETHSAHYLLVAVAHGDRIGAHLSRLLDNAPVTDAVVTAALRGKEYPLIAQPDGGYALQAADLALPGSATIEFTVVEHGATEKMAGTLQIAANSEHRTSASGARQFGWWALNFGVCIGFLVLIARRRNRAQS